MRSGALRGIGRGSSLCPPPVSHEINPPSEALRRANVARRAAMARRSAHRCGGRSPSVPPNMRGGSGQPEQPRRVARRDTVRRTVAKQRQTNRTMSGVAVAAALLVGLRRLRDLCLEVGRPRRRPGTPAVIIIGDAGAAGGHDARGRFRDGNDQAAGGAEEGSEQQPGEENDSPVVVEATPTPEART